MRIRLAHATLSLSGLLHLDFERGRLIPNRLIAEIKLAPSRYVKVGLTENAFLFVRYNTEQDQLLRFRGHPISRLEEDLTNFREFEASFVERVRKK
jgi:hypothetical protein